MSNTTDAFLKSVDSSEHAGKRTTGVAVSDEVMLETHESTYYGDHHALHRHTH